jgi:YD repeat-containing protein
MRRLRAIAAALSHQELARSRARSPAAASKTCRRYATAFTLDGAVNSCALDGLVYRCSGSSFTREWSYPSLDAFIQEAVVPNRILAVGRQTSGGVMLVSSGGWTTTYTYDGAGRLVGRERRGFNSFGRWSIDTTTYTSWDALSRPVSGEATLGDGTTMTLSLTYDDAARTVRVSNGELVTRDSDGNVVREVEFAGADVSQYGVTSTAQICE